MEFQAVILCGPGERLHPITTGTCKALLPVGNKPLVQYAIEWCKRAGFAGTTVAVSDEDYEAVEACCHAFELNVSLFRVPTGTNSGQILKSMEAAPGVLKPQRDIMVVPCDFITEIDPDALISAVRSQDDNTAITGFYYRNTLETLDGKLEPDVLLHSVAAPATKRYVSTSAQSDFLLDCYERAKVKDAKVLNARMAMLWKFPQVVATMDLLRSSFFFISRKVLAYDDISFDQPIAKVVRDVARRTWRHRQMRETVVMQYLPDSQLFLRANNLPAYMEANRNFLKQKARLGEHEHAEREPGQAVIGIDSLVGLNTSVGERSSVKRTAIGRNCTIGRKCRLNGCVILDDATIENDVHLENCIIGKGARIEIKSRLVWCYVEGNYAVVSETEAKNEVLKGLSMADLDGDEFGSSMYESLSDDDESDSEEEESDDFDEDAGDDDLFDRS